MITKIDISNFKCFTEHSFDFKPLTVLSGINAVGKSSLIQAVILAIKCNDLDEKISEESTVRISLKDLYGMNLGSISDILNNTQDIENFRIILSLTGDNEQEIVSDINGLDHVSFSAIIKRKGSEIVENARNFVNSQYISAERYGPQIIHEESDNKYNVGELGQFAISILNSRINDIVPIERCRLDSSLKLLLKSVEEWMQYIVPGTELRTELITEVEKIKFQIRNSKDAKFIKPTNTGFGISYVLPIIVAGMIAPIGSSIIIENPEAHLHPLGQSRIGEFLAQIANTGVQLIVETHSDHIINGIRLAVVKNNINYSKVIINFLSKDENQEVVIDKIDINNSGEIEIWPDGFLDQERNDLRTLMKSRLDR